MRHKVKITTNGNLPSTIIEVDGKAVYACDFKIELRERTIYLHLTIPRPELDFNGECEVEKIVNGLSSDQ